ncbi:amino acid/polyamine transporter I [Cyathus striatus]|nr:amino acid/polyamine transporter I [Cyathus striatus]
MASSTTEVRPLLAGGVDEQSESSNYGAISDRSASVERPKDENGLRKRQIGVFSAMFIIFNRIIGTGIFATPSMILSLSGSVGLSLIMWVIGALIAMAGMQVYIVWGTALPHNGGEKNYLEHLFPHPKRLITAMYAANAVLMAYAAGNAIVFAEYFLLSISPSSCHVTQALTKLTAALVLTFVLLLHGLHLPLGLRVQNALGVSKIIVLVGIVGTGVAAALGILRVEDGSTTRERPIDHNFGSWDRIWEGSRWGMSEFCLALYNVIWSYVGFSNANYALSEVHRPSRTLKLAGPLALICVTLLYLLANIAYLFGASKDEITGSGRLVAALLVRKVWGPQAERLLAVGVAMSAAGNVLSVSFSQARVNQALGQEGVLPFSKFWASTWPRNAPLTGLSLHWIVCILVIYFVPPGDGYNFVINVVSYPLAIINATISFGLIYLSLASHRQPTSIVPSAKAAVLFPALIFGLANVFLFLVPLIPPPDDAQPYVNLPYWTHALVGWSVFLLGGGWWFVTQRGNDL